MHDINGVHQMCDINRVHHVHNLDPTALRRPNMSSENDVRAFNRIKACLAQWFFNRTDEYVENIR